MRQNPDYCIAVMLQDPDFYVPAPYFYIEEYDLDDYGNTRCETVYDQNYKAYPKPPWDAFHEEPPDEPIDGAIVAPIKDRTYTGKKIEPKLSIKLGSLKLKEDGHYELKFSNNKKVGQTTYYSTWSAVKSCKVK